MKKKSTHTMRSSAKTYRNVPVMVPKFVFLPHHTFGAKPLRLKMLELGAKWSVILVEKKRHRELLYKRRRCIYGSSRHVGANMANKTKETAKIASISVPNVTVDINGTTYEYFMTNDIKIINTKLKELGCRSIVSADYRFNPNLAQSVCDKMVELHCTFSLLIAKNLMLINYYSGAGSPYIIYLQELIQQTSAIAATSDVVQKLNFISSEEGEKLCSNWNPLPMAIINKSTDMVKALLDAGANPNIWSSYGYTPLMLAVSSGKREIV